MQEILHWQCNTARMMYGLVGDAIRAKGVALHISRMVPAK